MELDFPRVVIRSSSGRSMSLEEIGDSIKGPIETSPSKKRTHASISRGISDSKLPFHEYTEREQLGLMDGPTETCAANRMVTRSPIGGGRSNSSILPRSYYPLMIGSLSSDASSWTSSTLKYSYRPDTMTQVKTPTIDFVIPIDPPLKSPSMPSNMEMLNERMTSHHYPSGTISLQEQAEDLDRLLLYFYRIFGIEKGPYLFDRLGDRVESSSIFDQSVPAYPNLRILEMTLNILQSQMIYEMADLLLPSNNPLSDSRSIQCINRSGT
jgi:hypothetical protein